MPLSGSNSRRMVRRGKGGKNDNGVDSLGWRDALKLRLEVLVDTFVVEGVGQGVIFDAISDELHGLREALARDPDPADDNSKSTLEEPSNDWPGAASQNE
jgi:hypothetical protein